MEAQIKVVLKQTYLKGLNGGVLQLVAVVYIDGEEFRVMAPPAAEGPALEWFAHMAVRQYAADEFGGGEVEIDDVVVKVLVLRSVLEELTQQRQRALEAMYHNAQICLTGHVQSCDGAPFDAKAHCPKCGASCIHSCSNSECGAPIRGKEKSSAADYSRPQYCHGCGKPYPWMADRLQTPRDLLYHDEKLTQDDRTALFEDLKYVMSNPLDPLTPAKKKLVEIRLGAATQYVREILTDLTAKYFAEMSKG